MKTINIRKVGLFLTALIGMQPMFSNAQVVEQAAMDNMRAYGKAGVNQFEPKKEVNTKFDGLKVRFGAGFTQSFQALSHENGLPSAVSNISKKDTNALYNLSAGFNTAL